MAEQERRRKSGDWPGRRIEDHLSRLLLETVCDAAVFGLDTEGRVTSWNAGAERLLGYEAGEVVGRHADLFRLPEEVERGALAAELRRTGKRGRLQTQGWRIHKDGSRFWADVLLVALYGREGDLLGFAGVIHNLSAWRRAEEAQRFLARAGALLASSLDYTATLRSVARLAVPILGDYCIVYLRDEEDGTLHRVEAAGEARLREADRFPLNPERPYPVLEVIRTAQPKLIADADPAATLEIMEDPRHREIFAELGLRSLLFAPLVARGRTLGAIGFFCGEGPRRFDEEDLRLAEEVGRRAALAIDNARLYQEAQHAIQARDEVVSIVSHDLRNPLNTILMSTEVLLDGVAVGRGRETERRQLEGILRASEGMSRMVQDLLDISRIESGRLVVERTPQPVGPLLAGACEALKPLARSRAVSLSHETPEAVPPVYVDPDHVAQVLSNLVGNAVKFTPNGGWITLRANGMDGEVCISVQDSGPGIPPEDLPRLWDRFWQASRTDRRGLGLGLPIVRGIVEAHGGRVWAESTPGQGSTFHFTLPVAPSAD